MKRRQKGQKHIRSLDEPPRDKMIRKPEKKKIWEHLSQRERDIHSKGA